MRRRDTRQQLCLKAYERGEREREKEKERKERKEREREREEEREREREQETSAAAFPFMRPRHLFRRGKEANPSRGATKFVALAPSPVSLS